MKDLGFCDRILEWHIVPRHGTLTALLHDNRILRQRREPTQWAVRKTPVTPGGRAVKQGLEKLTPRQKEVLRFLADGLSEKQIADLISSP